MDKSYGTFFANIDETWPAYITANSRSGYGYCLVAKDLPATEHRLNIILPSKMAVNPDGASLNGPVKLGYLLIAGEKQATADPAPVGIYTPQHLAALQFHSLPAEQWRWSGPFAPAGQSGAASSSVLNAAGFLQTPFPPETRVANIDWKPIEPSEGPLLDFRKLTGSNAPAIAYATTEIQSAEPSDAILAITCDYYAKIWLNGTLLVTLDKVHGGPKDSVLLPARLQAGGNRLLIKVGAGEGGFNFSAGLWQ